MLISNSFRGSRGNLSYPLVSYCIFGRMGVNEHDSEKWWSIAVLMTRMGSAALNHPSSPRGQLRKSRWKKKPPTIPKEAMRRRNLETIMLSLLSPSLISAASFTTSHSHGNAIQGGEAPS
jgi:hypothetical protein